VVWAVVVGEGVEKGGEIGGLMRGQKQSVCRRGLRRSGSEKDLEGRAAPRRGTKFFSARALRGDGEYKVGGGGRMRVADLVYLG